LLTDDLDMEALSGTVPSRAARAVAAGCDIALNCWARIEDMIGICDALPDMSAKTHERLDRALAATSIVRPPLGDQGALIAKRDALLALVQA
jgi:beta-N-acetylhexosaminidase